MIAALHGGPCEGRRDDNLTDPPPEVYTCREEVFPRDWDKPINPGQPTPEITYNEHRYRLDRVDRDVAHYKHAPEHAAP